jgi:hypothetical protein
MDEVLQLLIHRYGKGPKLGAHRTGRGGLVTEFRPVSLRFRHELPSRLRRLLYRALHLIPDSRYARRQTGGRALCAAG